MSLGFVAFFLPGLIVTTAFLLTPAVLVAENRPFVASLARARRIARGHGWACLLLVLPSCVIGAAGVALIASEDVPLGVLGGAVIGVALAFLAVAAAVAYADLTGIARASAATPTPAASSRNAEFAPFER